MQEWSPGFLAVGDILCHCVSFQCRRVPNCLDRGIFLLGSNWFYIIGKDQERFMGVGQRQTMRGQAGTRKIMLR